MPMPDWPSSSAAWGSRPLRRVVFAAAACAVCVGAGRAAAQVPAAAPAPAPVISKPVAGGLARTTCRGQIIDEVVLVSKPALYQARLPEFVPNAEAISEFVREAQSRFHSATKADAVLPFMLLHEGDACNERRRGESERVLRSQNYIADATITPYTTGNDHVLLVVETTDELSVVINGQTMGRSPYLTRLRLGNPNVYGYGVRMVGQWQAGQGFRDGYAGEFTKYAVFTQPVILSVQGERAPLGGRWQASLSKPFYTDFQRLAWSINAGERRGYLGLLRPDSEPVSLDVTRRFQSIGAVGRVGPPGQFGLFGLSVNAQRDETGITPVVVGRGVLIPTQETRLPLPYEPTNSVRVTGLVGFRQVKYYRAAGYDVVEGLQDMRTGVEVGGGIGRGIRSFGSDDSDWFATGGLFAGAGNSVVYASLNGAMEARWVPAAHQWDGLVTSAQGQAYWRMTPSQTVVWQTDWAAGDRMRMPFQLTAQEFNGGVRGFSGSRWAGAERLVFRLEDRIYVGRIASLTALAVAPFAEAGRVWRGAAPFGATSPVLGSMGIALLGAVPPQSQLTWRADLAIRVTPDPYAGRFQLRFAIRDAGRQLRPEANDIVRSRSSGVPTSLFTWP
jgi:hypothetical protein